MGTPRIGLIDQIRVLDGDRIWSAAGWAQIPGVEVSGPARVMLAPPDAQEGVGSEDQGPHIRK